MSAVANVLRSPEPAASPAAGWTSTGRVAAAATLVLGAGLQLASIVIVPDPDSTLEALRWTAEHPNRANLAQALFVLATPFLVATALVYVLLARERCRRLAYAGGILLGCGLVGLSAVGGYETLEVSLAQDGRFDLSALGAVVDDMSSAGEIALLLIFIPFAFVGLLTSAAALWRSRAVPRGAALLLAVFILVDLFLNEGLGLVPNAAAHVISFVAACWIASAVHGAGRAAPAMKDLTTASQGSLTPNTQEAVKDGEHGSSRSPEAQGAR